MSWVFYPIFCLLISSQHRTNRTLFRHVPTRHLKEDEIVDITSPTASGEGGVSVIEAAFEKDATDEQDSIGVYTTADQLSEKMLTMSLVPRARWQTLLNLEVIRVCPNLPSTSVNDLANSIILQQRNKPKEAPKAPEKAPFFLPSLGDKTNSLVTTATDAKDEVAAIQALEAERSRVMRMSRNAGESEFTRLLNDADGDYTSFLNHLKTLPPSSADLEIRSLQPEELVPFVDSLTQRLKSKKDYELVQTWINVFMKCHSEAIVSDVGGEDGERGLRRALGEWIAEQKREATRLAELVGYCTGVGGFLRSGR